MHTRSALDWSQSNNIPCDKYKNPKYTVKSLINKKQGDVYNHDIIIERTLYTHNVVENKYFLQNVYFEFFIFGKLTEWPCFVTYLSNDSHTIRCKAAATVHYITKSSN